MAKNLVFNLLTKGYEKAAQVSKEVVETAREAGKLSREAAKDMRQLVTDARQGAREARLLRREAGSKAGELSRVGERSSALQAASRAETVKLPNLSRVSQVGGLFNQGRGIASTLVNATSAASEVNTVSQAASILGSGAILALPGFGAAVALIVQNVAVPLLNEIQKQQTISLQDLEARTQAFVSEQFQTFEERIKTDPDFLRQASREASFQIGEQEAALQRRGLTPSTRGILEDE